MPNIIEWTICIHKKLAFQTGSYIYNFNSVIKKKVRNKELRQTNCSFSGSPLHPFSLTFKLRSLCSTYNLLLPTCVPKEREADLTPRISPNQFSTIMIKCKYNTRAFNFPHVVYVRGKLHLLYYTEKCKCTHCA